MTAGSRPARSATGASARGGGSATGGSGRGGRGRAAGADSSARGTAGASGRGARAVALEVLRRVDEQGAYANLALDAALGRSGLSARDRAFATDLVYGTTRMRRACDHLVDRFLTREVEPGVRNLLRLGAYQLAFAGVPAHAAVGETVELAPRRARGLVNAVLRRVAGAPVAWPDDATRLSVPDWVLAELDDALGAARARDALAAMNEAATVSARADGYVQDPASQRVAAAVDAAAGERVLDLCAAPGGKATALAAAGAHVVAADVRPARAGLVAANVARLAAGRGATGAGSAAAVAGSVAILAADGTAPPLRPGTFDRVLVDAPCTGLGTLRRRADLRWRVEPGAVTRLAELQRALLGAAADLVRPGGTLVYSVCTLTGAESLGVDGWLAEAHPALVPLPAPEAPWEPWGRGAVLLPQAAGTDGMCLFRYRRSGAG